MTNTDSAAPPFRRIVQHIFQRELALPLLCLIAGHRPLAFVAGQMLYLLEPLAMLLGQNRWSVWAAWLSDPAGYDQLTQALASPMPDQSIQTIDQPPPRPHEHGLA